MSEIREERDLAKDFAALMRGKLRLNCFKAHWREMEIPDLLDLLLVEIEELKVALVVASDGGYDHAAIRNECADVGNFAAMIAWHFE